jgi:hypothetical protein
MSNNIFIHEIKNSIPDILCNEIITMFELENGRYEGVTIGGLNKNIKDTTDFIIPKKNIIWKKIEGFLYNELYSAIKLYFKDRYSPDNNFTVDDFLIIKYEKNKGKYLTHNDFYINYNEKKYRVITFLWYLNNINEGGETVFYNDNIKIIPETGKLILFPCSWTFPHSGSIPYSNNKYIITGWVYLPLG